MTDEREDAWEVRVSIPPWKEGKGADGLSMRGPLSEFEARRIARRWNEGCALGYYAAPMGSRESWVGE